MRRKGNRMYLKLGFFGFTRRLDCSTGTERPAVIFVCDKQIDVAHCVGINKKSVEYSDHYRIDIHVRLTIASDLRLRSGNFRESVWKALS